ncbi:hypothetical protein KBD87_02315 [Candidatus Saccharibacteria bacterium]|nr:hypothetical protein [Candidatus Saccharibacteria bacterium]
MNNTSLLASPDDVSNAIAQMATRIIKDYRGSSPLFVALLRGAAPFTSKLMFEIARQDPEFHAELDYMMVSTYGTDRTAGEPRIVTGLAPDTIVQDRTAIILDDVLDKGITANFVMSHLKSRGARTVKLAVLCDKRTTRTQPVSADYYCFQFDDVWLAGMGMDNAHTAPEAYR